MWILPKRLKSNILYYSKENKRLNVLYERNWTRLVHEQLRKFETSIVAATKVEGFNSQDLLEQERHWSFTGSLLYSVTIITTIGYGNLAPKTPEGKIVTMFYALIGVPLMLVCLSSLGALLADTFQFIYSFLCCIPCTTTNSNSNSSNSATSTSQHHQIKSKRQKTNEYNKEKGYVHTYQKAPIISSTTPSPRHYHHHHRRKSREAVGGSIGHVHEELREISTFPRRTMLATVNTAACGRPKLQSRALSTELHHMTTNMSSSGSTTGEAHHLLAECTDCSSTPVHLSATLRRSTIPTPPPPRPPASHHIMAASLNTTAALSTTETDDGDDMDDNQSSLCTHDTPSRMPLIWRASQGHHHRQQDGGETSNSKSRKSQQNRKQKNSNNISKKLKRRKSRTFHNVPIILVLVILIAYVCVGAYFFGELNNNWTYLDGVYFCFTTLSTIGFGDFVPGILNNNNNNKDNISNKQGQYIYLIACCTYLLIGLVLIAMSFSLVQDEIITKCRRTAIAFGFITKRYDHRHH